MMTISRFKNLLAALILAFALSVAFGACSSSEESSDSGCKKGAQGICCDADPMQEGCAQ